MSLTFLGPVIKLMGHSEDTYKDQYKTGIVCHEGGGTVLKTSVITINHNTLGYATEFNREFFSHLYVVEPSLNLTVD